jgi:hypothetical protein
MHRRGLAFRDSTVLDNFMSVIKVPFQAAFAAFPVLALIDIKSGVSNPRVWGISRGALLAAPILLLFVVLFSSADANFSRYVLQVADLFSPEGLRQLVIIFVFSWLATGLLSGVYQSPTISNKRSKSFLKMGTDDTAVFMGLITALFIAFVVLQLNYLFGGRETIVSTTGLTLAAYARRGFFELVSVAGLTLILLVTISSTNCNQRVFRPLAGIMIACVLVILLSAAQRLSLYISEFGLTIDRLTAVAAMIWLTIGLLLFSVTVLRGRIRDFAAGLIVAGITVGFIFALANPAAVVANVNIDRVVNDNKPIDINYLTFLGADAVPVIMGRIDVLPMPIRCVTSTQTLNRWHTDHTPVRVQFGDWRSWNASQAKARALVMAKAPELLLFSQACR